ncbi:DUF2207 domain-containing protein [Candidatus Saccharibacteria bacterium]|nr:DUF2207 domain-containing protein [Candidatus Saccharibacteria bacterium]
MLTALEQGALSFSLRGVEVTAVPFALLALFGAIFILPIIILRKKYFISRRLKKTPITAEYLSPLDLNPAEIGYLFDGKLKELEVGATIIHLIQRGLLHVKKVDEKKRIFAGPRIDDSLKSYEKKLIEATDNPDGVTAEVLVRRFTTHKNDSFSFQVMARETVFTQFVHSDLSRRQFVRDRFMLRFLFSSFKIFIMVSIFLIYLPFAGAWAYGAVINGATDSEMLIKLLVGAFFISIYFFIPLFVISVILNYYRAKIVGRQWLITEKLKRHWPQIVGYRQYVKMLENNNLKFNAKSLAEHSKTTSLPYAVALGFVKNWRDIIS